MDTNPMVQGTDTLTDALNAALITMNGNEVILQNDMGNRRVNNAFLPSGYEPVGMKEYGGIIYVAAYNPITNKSQIGSFPSPQKKIGSNNELRGEFDFGQFFRTKEEANETLNYNVEFDSYLKINVLKSDSFLIPLTGNYNLRAGDKFSIYSPDLYNYQEEITVIEEQLKEIVNEDETIEKITIYVRDKKTLETKDLITNFYNTNYYNNNIKKVKTPKNKRYTLSAGVLNSQNEFVDITKTLCRWKQIGGKSTIQDYDSSYSDIYKFNDGYFIASEFSNREFAETINNTNLIKERQKLEVNTYAYKLVGPLYLKVQLNHIENFNYNIIYGKYVQGKATLTIEGYFTYNCPDWAKNTISRGNEIYETFEEGLPTFNGFDFINFDTGEILTPISPIIVGQSIYDSITNTYSVKITKTYENISPSVKDTTLFNYVIGVNVDNTDIYLKGLSAKGQIDFSLFGSGTIYFTEWRFFNNLSDSSYTNLIVNLVTYPKPNKQFTNLRLVFTDITKLNEDNPPTITLSFNELFNGRQGGQNLYWNDFLITENTLYQVTALYDVLDLETNDYFSKDNIIDVLSDIRKVEYKVVDGKIVEDEENTKLIANASRRWFLSTELFNDAFDSITDYCNTNDEEFLNLMNVPIETNFKISQKFEDIDDSQISGEYGNGDNLLKYNIVKKGKLTLNLEDYSCNVVNRNFYPTSFIFEDLGSMTFNNSVELKIKDFSIVLGQDQLSSSELILETPPSASGEFKVDNTLQISGTLQVETSFVGYCDNQVQTIKNVFSSFKKDLIGRYASSGYCKPFNTEYEKQNQKLIGPSTTRGGFGGIVGDCDEADVRYYGVVIIGNFFYLPNNNSNQWLDERGPGEYPIGMRYSDSRQNGNLEIDGYRSAWVLKVDATQTTIQPTKYDLNTEENLPIIYEYLNKCKQNTMFTWIIDWKLLLQWSPNARVPNSVSLNLENFVMKDGIRIITGDNHEYQNETWDDYLLNLDTNTIFRAIKVWWRTTNNKWVLLPNFWNPLEIVGSSGQNYQTYVRTIANVDWNYYVDDYIKLTFAKYIDEQFSNDYTYNMYSSKTIDDLTSAGIPVSSNIQVPLDKYKYFDPNINLNVELQQIKKFNCQSYAIGNLNFIPKYLPINYNNNIPINSSIFDFEELIDEFAQGIIRNVDIYSGQMLDVNGILLNIDGLYTLNYQGKLQRATTQEKYIQVSHSKEMKTYLEQNSLLYIDQTSNETTSTTNRTMYANNLAEHQTHYGIIIDYTGIPTANTNIL